VRRSKRHREPSFRQFIITQLGSVSNQYLRFFAVFQLQGQFFYRDGPVRAQPLQYTAAGLKAGIVDLIPPGIHNGAEIRLQMGQRPRHGFQRGDARAGLVPRPGQPLGRGHADPKSCKGPWPRRHGHDLHLLQRQPAVFQEIPAHGHQRSAVREAAVLEGLGQERLVLTHRH